ncbi:MAG: YdcF family protein [Kutzneria sp.]|nr:YdcF family protein [Kutzneria sp.]
MLVAGTLASLACVPALWTHTASQPYVRNVDDVPNTPVAIVFGAAVHGDTPTPFLAGRLDVATDLYRHGKIRAVLVSGDNGSTDYDEPSAMRHYLVEHGVPDHAVVADYAGFDTWDTCVRAKRIFGVDRAAVVTQGFHLPRAVALCRAAGIDAYGVGHDSSRISASTTRYGEFREFFADGKAMWDALVARPDPRFLGPREPGVANALRQR